MSLTAEDVKRIAHLARIEMAGGETDEVLARLGSILAMIEDMRAVDATGVAPMAHARDVVLRLREDAVTEPDRREQFQAGAPAVEAGLYLVPKVIE